MKVGFVSLGCPKNQLDTEVMLHELALAGYEITAEESEADIVIINTCAFIESAKQEAIDNILDIAWLKENANLKGIVVTGCLAERYREQIMEEMPEVDAVLGVGSIHHIVKAVGIVSRGGRYQSFLDKEAVKLGGDRVLTTPSYMAYLKIAEGCDNRCTYCAIPNIRGRFRSRPIEELVAEAKDMEALGVKELILVAQDTTRYGQDLYGEYKLTSLIQKICEATTIPWLRLLYCYPDKITDELVQELAQNPRLCKYVDIPIQHINDRVLRKMNRHGGTQTVKDAIARLKENVPGITLRSTVICGFPTETEEEFHELYDFLEETRFDCLGAFPYSREEDTPAYDFDGQIDTQTKQDRADAVMLMVQRHMAEANEKLIGKTITILCEGYDPVSNVCYGRSEAQAPEIDGKIYFSANKKPREGEFVQVHILKAVDYDLVGHTEN
jgi:ribosomal protein S12 methylthiotransferase